MAYVALEDTSLWADIKAVIESKKKTTRFDYKALLHTETDDIPILKVLSIDIVADYVNNVGEQLLVSLKMPLGDYVKRVFPFRANLEVSIKRIEVEKDTVRIGISRITTERYKAIFLVKENPAVSGTDLERMDYQTLNNSDMVDVKLQLLDRSLEPLRIKTVSGIFQNVTQKQVIHSLLCGESQKVMVDGKSAVDGIDIVEPENVGSREHVIIPSGTNITSIPTILQEKMGGVYSTGIGNFLQRYNKQKLWFVYPLFNTKRFNTSKPRAIFYSIPKDRFPTLDQSYLKEGGILSILATGDIKYQDSAEVDNMNAGIGFRMANANTFMTKPIKITEDGPVGIRNSINNEVALRERKDGLQYAPMSNSPSANPFVECSKIMAREVSRIDLSWENCDSTLLYPGMPCRCIYLRLGKPVVLEGIVAFVHTTVALTGNNVNASIYTTNCAVTLLCKLNTELSDVPTDVDNGDW